MTWRNGENVKIFHSKFVHADEAFCGGKWALCNRGEDSADKKGSARSVFFAQTHAFVQLFWLYFAAFHLSVSTPQKKKSTPNFSAALTFESRRTPFFEKVSASD
ncbi:MAG: hypothetical protein K6D55_04770 [Prevotella sp.]|nr:hypothetical protein [Prevotella sp.]